MFVLVPKMEISALNTEEIIEELKFMIVARVGSADPPYEMDYDKVPHFKEYMYMGMKKL